VLSGLLIGATLVAATGLALSRRRVVLRAIAVHPQPLLAPALIGSLVLLADGGRQSPYVLPTDSARLRAGHARPSAALPRRRGVLSLISLVGAEPTEALPSPGSGPGGRGSSPVAYPRRAASAPFMASRLWETFHWLWRFQVWAA
jgi:hypothetical protein